MTFCLIVYFLFHALNGERGLFAFIKLNKTLKQQTEILIALQDERKSLENKVSHLNPKTLDKDALDEIARHEMGLIAPDEKMIVMKKSPLTNSKTN